MKLVRKMLVVLLILMFMFSLLSVTASHDNEISVIINGQQIEFDGQGPIIINDQIYIPVRGVFEALGFYSTWNHSTRRVILTRGNDILSFAIGSYFFIANDGLQVLEAPALIISNRAMLPLRSALRGVGYNADWNPTARTITISSFVIDVDDDKLYDFVQYVNNQYGFILYHPNSWIHPDDPGITDDAINDLIDYYLGIGGLVYSIRDIAEQAVQWLVPAADESGFGSASVRVTDAVGISQAMIRSEWIKSIMCAAYDAHFMNEDAFENFERTNPVTGALIGGNYFLLFESSVTLLGAQRSLFHAHTEINGYEIAIMFIMPHGAIDMDTVMAVLASLDALCDE